MSCISHFDHAFWKIFYEIILYIDVSCFMTAWCLTFLLNLKGTLIMLIRNVTIDFIPVSSENCFVNKVNLWCTDSSSYSFWQDLLPWNSLYVISTLLICHVFIGVPVQHCSLEQSTMKKNLAVCPLLYSFYLRSTFLVSLYFLEKILKNIFNNLSTSQKKVRTVRT